MLESLPDEVFFEILSRLPMKEIIRSRCVSKTWCSLICSPDFIATHLNRSLSNPGNPPYLLFRHLDGRLKKARLTLHSSDVPFSSNNFTELRTSHLNIHRLRIIAGSSNGLLCLASSFWHLYSGRFSGVYVLWNPSIQKAVTLPNPDAEIGYCNKYITSLGFGYVPKTDDYKLVRLVFCYPHLLSNIDDIVYGIADWVQIYTLRNHAWRTVRVHGPPYHMRKRDSATFLHGRVHWPAYIEQHRGERRHVIVSFDLADEAFREVGMPESLENTSDCEVAVLNGLIVLVQQRYKYQEPRTVWVMKEYGKVESWTKLFDIEMLGDIEIFGRKMLYFDRVIGFRETGETLLEMGGDLFSYEPSSQRTVSLPFYGRKWSFFLDKYVESLVLLNVPGTDLEELI